MREGIAAGCLSQYELLSFTVTFSLSAVPSRSQAVDGCTADSDLQTKHNPNEWRKYWQITRALPGLQRQIMNASIATPTPRHLHRFPFIRTRCTCTCSEHWYTLNTSVHLFRLLYTFIHRLFTSIDSIHNAHVYLQILFFLIYNLKWYFIHLHQSLSRLSILTCQLCKVLLGLELWERIERERGKGVWEGVS